MSRSDHHNWVALVSVDDQAIIGGIVNRNLMEIDFAERQPVLEEAQEVLRRVAQYTEPKAMVQMVCDHAAQIIALQKQITDLQTRQFLPPECNHLMFKQQLETLSQELEEARRIPRTAGTDEDLRQELDDMARDTRHSGEEVRALRMQVANALSSAARVAPNPPQQPEDRGEKFPDSPDFSGSDQGQLRGWIAQLRMVIQHKPASIPNEQLMMRYAFNRSRREALDQMLPQIREDGDIRLEDLPALI